MTAVMHAETEGHPVLVELCARQERGIAMGLWKNNLMKLNPLVILQENVQNAAPQTFVHLEYLKDPQ